MAKGVLMSKDGNHGVILTKDGSFEKIKLPFQHVSIGEEINVEKRTLSIPKPVMTALAACLVLLALFGAFQWQGQNRAVAAYISFDINPSFEAGVNRQLKVVEIHPMNSDGSKIVKEIKNYKNMPLDSFTQKVASVLDKAGYFKQDPNMVVSTTLTSNVNKTDQSQLTTKINEAIDQIKKTPDFNNNKGTLHVLSTSDKERQAAAKLGLTAGKYSLYEQAKKAAPKLTPDKAKSMTVKALLNQTADGKGVSGPKPSTHRSNQTQSHTQTQRSDKDHQPGQTKQDTNKSKEPPGPLEKDTKQHKEVPGQAEKSSHHVTTSHQSGPVNQAIQSVLKSNSSDQKIKSQENSAQQRSKSNGHHGTDQQSESNSDSSDKGNGHQEGINVKVSTDASSNHKNDSSDQSSHHSPSSNRGVQAQSTSNSEQKGNHQQKGESLQKQVKDWFSKMGFHH